MDILTELILDEYRSALPMMQRLRDVVVQLLKDALQQNGIEVTTVSARVKTEKSLQGKLVLKGGKYHTLSDVTDIVGVRVITFYTDDVDRIAALAEQLFDIDWQNSVDKRRLHQLDSFGYNSLHYICKVPARLFRDADFPGLNDIPFELQLRTTLQHAWAAINHDTGYKTGVEIPREYLRQMNRLAGMLELADDEFSRIRTEISDYRRRVDHLLQNGKLDDLMLDGESFRSYINAKPFDTLNKRIAAINQAEIQEVPLNDYLTVLKALNCRTIGDVSRLVNKYESDAYRLARHQLGTTDIDIIASSLSLQNVCIVCILKQGGGKIGLKRLYDVLNGESEQNSELAQLTYDQAAALSLI